MDLSHDHGLDLVHPLTNDSGRPLVESAMTSFLRRGSKILVPVLRWPTAARIDTVHLFGVASLVVVRWAQSFVMLGPFSLLLELAEVRDLRFAKLGKLFIQFWHSLWPFPD
jgi:hypothetical protein